MVDNAAMDSSPTSENPPAWHLLGAGAMGCLWASSLASAGRPVRLLLRDLPPGTRTDQVTLLGIDGHERVSACTVEARTETGPIARLLVCTKAAAVLPALRGVAGRIAPGAAVVLLQNGMGFQQQAASLLPRARLYCAVSTEGAWREGPMRVRHAGRGSTWLGAWSTTGSAQAEAIAREMGAGFLAVQPVADIHPALWRKLAVNCAINPLTALHGCPNGALLDDPALHAHFEALCTEIATVLRGLGQAALADAISAEATAVARATAANRSSMRQDLEAGRPTEIAFINGYLCERAREAGIPAPIDESLCAAIRERERAGR